MGFYIEGVVTFLLAISYYVIIWYQQVSNIIDMTLTFCLLKNLTIYKVSEWIYWLFVSAWIYMVVTLN